MKRKISARPSPANKLALGVWCGMAGLIAFLFLQDLIRLKLGSDAWGTALAFVLAVGVGYAVFRFMKAVLLDLYMDAVYDCGDHLLVEHKGETERIPFMSIRSVEAWYSNPRQVRVYLNYKSKFGKEISLLPNVCFFQYSGYVKALRLRIAEEKRNGV